MRQSRRVRVLVGAVALVAGLGTLAGCGDGGTSAGSKDASTKAGTGTATTATPTATPTVVQGLPADFPKDEVPVLDEKVVTAVKGPAGGPVAWTVVMTSSRAIDDLSKEVAQDFAAAGYTSGRANELGDVSIHRFSNASHEVGVTIARTGDGITITYLVKDKP